ncbi:MAG: hypothetical protein RJQ21_08195 [Rhodospirillales bacterium]
MKLLVALLTIVLVAACAQTRDPQPVGIKQANDDAVSCIDIETEYKTNTEIASYKISKNNSDDGRDVLIGFFIWPGLADFKNADGIEGNALLDRNIFLRQMADQKNCDIRNWPSQPTRYS